MLSNRMRDQEIQIKGLREEVTRIRIDMMGKMDTIEQLLHVILEGGKDTGNIGTQCVSVAQVEGEHVETIMSKANPDEQIASKSSRYSSIVAPPGGSLAHDKQHNSCELRRQVALPKVRIDGDNSSTSQAGCSVVTGSDEVTNDDVAPPPKRKYADIASTQGPWLTKMTKKKSSYRDEPDRYAQQDKSTRRNDNWELKGAGRESISLLYVRNIDISDQVGH